MKKLPKPAPKKLYVRFVQGGTRLSVGEYIRAKWRNVVDPFRLDDKTAVVTLSNNIKHFVAKTGRSVEIEAYRGETSARKELDRLFALVNEKGGK